MKKITAFVVNHGHMDIEWYQPLDSYRPWFSGALETLMKLAEEDGEYKSYVMDGAVFPVEAALEEHPEYENAVRELVRDGKLLIGPFYTQFDEFLPCGENIIMNCLWGARISARYGKTMKAGYLPDNFGHPSQLPQILRGFGIDSLMFTRGMADAGGDTKEFVFTGDDGSALNAVNFGYSSSFNIYANNNPAPPLRHLSPYTDDYILDYNYLLELSAHRDNNGIARQLVDNVRNAAQFYPSGIVPVFIGCDHCPPSEGLTETLRVANEMQPDIDFVFGDAGEYAKLLKESFGTESVGAYRGDLTGTRTDYLLLGAMTARTYLKRENDRCERIMFDYALPLHACAYLYGRPRQDIALGEAIKKLLLNSTHDSIHGSSVDAVHLENEYRFSSAEQTALGYAHASLESIGNSIASPGLSCDGRFMVYTPDIRDGRNIGHVMLETGDDDVELFDSAGNNVQCEILRPAPEVLNANGQSYCGEDNSLREVIFESSAAEALELYGYRKTARGAKYAEICGDAIENEYIAIRAEGNVFTLTDKENGRVYKDVNLLCECADAGDVWDFAPPWLPCESYDSRDFKTKRVEVKKGELRSEITVEYEMALPERLNGDKRDENLLPVRVIVACSLYKGIKRADVHIEIDNRVRDHRVSLRLPLNVPPCNITAGGLFTAKECRPELYFDREGWIKPSTRELPFRDWISAKASGSGLLTAVRGLYTYEPDDDGVFIPLFRSVGIMTKSNLTTRKPGGFGGYHEVEGAQCLRRLSFEFCYIPLEEGETSEDAEFILDGYLRPPLAHSLRYEGVGKQKPALSPFKLECGKNIKLSAFRRSYDGEYYVLRLYEQYGKASNAFVSSDIFDEFRMSTLGEETGDIITVRGNKITLCFRGHEIKTILMKRTAGHE